MALVATPGRLWAIMFDAGKSSFRGYPIWLSTDGGRSWDAPADALAFLARTRSSSSAGATPAPRAAMSTCSTADGTTARLIRAPADNVADSAAHEYFSGSATAPAWSTEAADASPVFADPAGVWSPAVTHVPGLGRYLLTVAHSTTALPSANRLGVFEARDPWGPWRTVYYVDDFLDLRGGFHLGMHFPIKWQSADGRTLWATFSCHDNAAPGSCGQYHDRFNIMQVTLTVDEAGGDPGDGVGEDDGTEGDRGTASERMTGPRVTRGTASERMTGLRATRGPSGGNDGTGRGPRGTVARNSSGSRISCILGTRP